MRDWSTRWLIGGGVVFVGVMVAVVATASTGADAIAPAKVFATVDQAGSRPSMVLDASGFPVISFYDARSSGYSDEIQGSLRLVHCNDVACAGGDDIAVVVDPSGDTGLTSSLMLDGSGFPVISYHEEMTGELRLLHCNDADCAGGDDIPVTVDGSGVASGDSSMVLDSSGFPAISYAYAGGSRAQLRLVRCNDVDCAGGDDIPTTVEVGSFFNEGTSLKLDVSDLPVIAYSNVFDRDIRLVHCNDPRCADGDESPVVLEATGGSTRPSLALDGSGFPVVSYHALSAGELRMVHCNDPGCAGDDDTPIVVDDGFTGAHPSMVLDGSGFPVISYHDLNLTSSADDVYDGNLQLVHCNDPDCSDGDDTPVIVDRFGDTGLYSSLVLDGSGFPVISYTQFDLGASDGEFKLRLVRCDDARCVDDATSPIAIVDLVAGQPVLSNSTVVVFEINFAEWVTGLDGDDITVSGTAGATTAIVDGFNDRYTVTINKIPNDGTVVLEVADGAATDEDGNPSTTSIVVGSVTIDRSAAVIEVPTEPIVVAAAPGEATANVTFAVAATDPGSDASVAVDCDPASGSAFRVGTTTVSCTATDRAGNMATATLAVTVTVTVTVTVNATPVAQLPATGPTSVLITPAISSLAIGFALLAIGRRRSAR